MVDSSHAFANVWLLHRIVRIDILQDGPEQAHAAYLKLAGDENSTFNRFRRSLWAKVGGGVLIIFVVLAMAHGFRIVT